MDHWAFRHQLLRLSISPGMFALFALFCTIEDTIVVQDEFVFTSRLRCTSEKRSVYFSLQNPSNVSHTQFKDSNLTPYKQSSLAPSSTTTPPPTSLFPPPSPPPTPPISTPIAIPLPKCTNTWQCSIQTPSFSTRNLTTTYPRLGTLTVSFRNGLSRLNSGTALLAASDHGEYEPHP